MTRHLILPFLLVLCTAAAAQAPATVGVEGIAFPIEHRAGDAVLRMHGSGVFRAYVVLRVYAAALYLAHSDDARRVLEDVPKRLEIYYFHNTPKNMMIETADKTIAGNLTSEELAAVRARVDQFHGLYRDPRRGDRFTITYLPGVGTELAFNGEPQGVIPGADFAAAYFGVWLGKKPSSEEMKKKLLRQ
jgi:hypothetical protein